MNQLPEFRARITNVVHGRGGTSITLFLDQPGVPIAPAEPWELTQAVPVRPPKAEWETEEEYEKRLAPWQALIDKRQDAIDRHRAALLHWHAQQADLDNSLRRYMTLCGAWSLLMGADVTASLQPVDADALPGDGEPEQEEEVA